MTVFIIKRLAYAFLVLLGIVSLVFVLFSALPDPARMAAGQRSDVASMEAITREFGLDQPLYVQYFHYINDLSPISVHPNTDAAQKKYRYNILFTLKQKAVVIKFPYLRRSFQSKKEVSVILKEAFPGTFILALAAMIFASIVGVAFGVWASVRQNTPVDHLLLFFSTAGISLPSFFAAIIISWLFGFVWSDMTGLSMTGSLTDLHPVNGTTLEIKNLILPAFALGIRPLAIITQLTRSSMLEVLSKDYIRTAVAKGLSRKKVLYKHALRNALNPVLTAISGWFASLLAGAFFVEYIFNWRGIGSVTIEALEKSDLPVVMGTVLFVAVIFIVVNIIVDILYVKLDPRVSL